MTSAAEHECPNCHNKFKTRAAPEAQDIIRPGQNYSLLRGEVYLDADAVPYTDARDSEDQIGVEGSADVEDKAKGAVKV